MTAARKTQDEIAVDLEKHRSGEHPIELDEMIRNRFEQAFVADLQATSQVSKFELEGVLASPEVRPTQPPGGPPIAGIPIVNVGSLPTKEEERDP
jgi:hypothetical protein